MKPFTIAKVGWVVGILLLIASTARSQGSDQSPSSEIMNRYIAVYEYILEIKLNTTQRAGLQRGLTAYWKNRDQQAIQHVTDDVAYYDKKEEQASLRATSQLVIVEALRRQTKDSVAIVLVAAFDATHPDRKQATQAKGFKDLVGIWRQSDGVLAEKTPGGQQMGVSYTKSNTLQISADGRFKLVKINTTYSGSCRRLDVTTETGKVSADGALLVFDVQSGTDIVQDVCTPSVNQRKKLSPRKERFPWSIRPNANNNNALTLCWNTSSTTAVCYEKQ